MYQILRMFPIFVCVGVMFSGEYDVCDVTLSVHPSEDVLMYHLVRETEESKHIHMHSVLICNHSVFETLKMFTGHVFLFICFNCNVFYFRQAGPFHSK